MKLFRSLVRQFEEIRSRESVRRLGGRFSTLQKKVQISKQAPKSYTQPEVIQTSQTQSVALKENLLSPDLSRQTGDRFKKTTLKHSQRLVKSALPSPLIWGIAVVSITSAFGYRFYNAPKLDVGRKATQTIYAPTTATVEDSKATEETRKAARTGSVPVLKYDDAINQQIQRQIDLQIEQIHELRHLAGPFPYVSTRALTASEQATLRQISEADWQMILTTVDPSFPQNSFSLNGITPELPDSVTVTREERSRAIAKLKAYRRSVDLGSYLLLLREVTEARLRYSSALTSMPQPLSTELPPSFILDAIDLTDSDWRQVQRKTPHLTERILTQGITPGLPSDLLAAAIQLQVKDSVPASAAAVTQQLILAFLQPNLIRDEELTRQRAEKAALDIEPITVNVRRGDTIVREGETISSADFALLEHFKLSRREIDWFGLVSFGALVSGSVAVVWVVKRRVYPNLRKRDGLLLWLLSLSTPLLIALQVPSTNLPAVGLLIGSFFGAPLGITVTGLLTVLIAVGVDIPASFLVSSAIGGIICAWFGSRLRSREELALLGVGVGVLQGTLYLLLNIASGIVWYTLLGASAIQGVIGLAWVIISMGSSPFLEQLFDLVTSIRLVELANPNRPLLKRLAAEAPGTFQHTLFVATLAEAAACALGCNVELVRAGTLYHDIGKMHDPLGFIENQMSGTNKHDLIKNPWKSAEIIKKHVTEGLVMARKARLPKAVQAFIPEHQGTMLIAYFFHQAQQQQEDASETASCVKEADFRYDGPIPQSRETGIVMLADSCEAALRSLKDATPEEALAMINKILRARWQDNQLIDSGLTREEMTQIANIFVQVWQQVNHKRIAYPKLLPTPQAMIGS